MLSLSKLAPQGPKLLLALVLSGCAIQPENFGKTSLDESFLQHHLPAPTREWVAYDTTHLQPDYTEDREKVLSQDPARGIGLKQAESMGGGPATVPERSRFRVFLLMGQSNMVGQGRSNKLDALYKQKHQRIRIWARNQWQYLVPRKNFGPEVTFAHEMAEFFPKDTIGIIKIAVSGTGINAWKPDWDWAAANKTGDALKGSLYRDMINAVTNAKAISDFQLSGFIWKQGGRDARKADLSNSYQDRFVELVKHLRIDLGAPELPVFVLTYFDELGIEANRQLLEKVRPKAFPLYLSKARISEYVPNAYPVFHGRLPSKIDQVHFNTEGQILLGELTAEAVANYYTEQEPIKQSTSGASAIIYPPDPD